MVTIKTGGRASPPHQNVGVSSEDDANNDDDDDDDIRVRRRRMSNVSTKVSIWRLFVAAGGNDVANPVVRLSGTVGGRHGILDVSKDCRVAVDGLLQVFSLVDGSVIARFRLPVNSSKRSSIQIVHTAQDSSSTSNSSSSGASSEDDDARDGGGSPREFSRFRLTEDGQYVVWTERRAVCIGRVSDETVIACTATHERPTGLSDGLDLPTRWSSDARTAGC